MYIQDGGVKLSVVNGVGRMAVVGMLGPGDFFGEGCLAGQQVRLGTATAILSTATTTLSLGELPGALSRGATEKSAYVRARTSARAVAGIGRREASVAASASSTRSKPWRSSSSLMISGGQTHNILNRLKA